MAVTYAFTNLIRESTSKRRNRGTVTATGTYTATGDAVTPALFGLSVLEELILSPATDGTSVFVLRYIPSTGKIKAFTASAAPGAAVPLVEVTAGTSLSTYACECEAVGR